MPGPPPHPGVAGSMLLASPSPGGDGKHEPTTPKPRPGEPWPQRTCSWWLASRGSSEWRSSLTSAPGRHARCLGSSGQPGGSPCGHMGRRGMRPGIRVGQGPGGEKRSWALPASYPHPVHSGARPRAVPAANGPGPAGTSENLPKTGHPDSRLSTGAGVTVPHGDRKLEPRDGREPAQDAQPEHAKTKT